jgi:hypothetical protein
MKTARIGLIGYKFMGKAHSHAYKDVEMFFNPTISPVMKCICGRHRHHRYFFPGGCSRGTGDCRR